MNFTNMLTLLVTISALMASGGCRKDSPNKTDRVKAEGESVLDEINVETSSFTDASSDGRGVAYSDWADIYSKIDFTKIHPKTQEFYQTTSQSHVDILIEEDRRKDLFVFSNIYDSVAMSDVIKGIKEGCLREAYTSLKACIDDAIAKSGAVVFEMKQKLGNASNPNDENHIRDALYGLLGATFINSPTPTGGTELRMTTACVACHNSVSSKVNGSNTTLFVDFRGDNSYSDVLRNRDLMISWNEFKSYVADPTDPIWATSAETKAMGYLAAQYLKLKGDYEDSYGFSDATIHQNAHKANIKSVVDAGWVSAFASWISTARNWKQNVGLNNTDANIAKTTEKTTALNILTQREDLVRPWSVIAPFRAQRSVLSSPSSLLTHGEQSAANFAFGYLNYSGSTSDSPQSLALPYLLSATSISFVFPGVEDAALSNAWYNTTPAGADLIVKRELPRTVIKNYNTDAARYHQARYVISKPVPKTHVQTIDLAHVNAGNTLIHSTCFSCHSTAKANISSTALTNACFGKTDCFIRTDNLSNAGSTYVADTPASVWATSVMSKMETAPEAFNLRYFNSVTPNSSIKSYPSRIPLLRRQALGLWTYPSYLDAVNTTRPAPRYGVLSSKLSLNRTVPYRKAELSFDINGDGKIGLQDMHCFQSRKFDLDGDGIAETPCYDALKIVSGATPRPIGQGDAIEFHKNAVAFPTTAANRLYLSNMLAAYADGAFNVKWTNGTITYVRIVPSDTNGLLCMDGDNDCGVATWKGFSTGGGSGGGSAGPGL